MKQNVIIGNIKFIADTDEKYCREEYGEDIVGLYEMTFPAAMIKEYFAYLKTENLEVPYLEAEEDYSGAHERGEYDLTSTNTDFCICVMSWADDYQKKRWEVTVKCDHISWLFHDMEHARHEGSPTEVCCANGWIEYERILEGCKAAKKRGAKNLSPSYIGLILAGFSSRFKREGCGSKLSVADFKEIYPRLKEEEFLCYEY
jgi:hypothetical protein